MDNIKTKEIFERVLETAEDFWYGFEEQIKIGVVILIVISFFIFLGFGVVKENETRRIIINSDYSYISDKQFNQAFNDPESGAHPASYRFRLSLEIDNKVKSVWIDVSKKDFENYKIRDSYKY